MFISTCLFRTSQAVGVVFALGFVFRMTRFLCQALVSYVAAVALGKIELA
jgi:hypothetical protein